MKMTRKCARDRGQARFDDVYRRVLLHCPRDLYNELAEIAHVNRCSLGFVVRDALERYVEDVLGFAALKSSKLADDAPAEKITVH